MNANTSRIKAVDNITSRLPTAVEQTEALEDIWAIDVFNLAKMETSLSKEAYEAIKKTIKTGDELSGDVAEEVATAMKDWALSKGVKFFSHIFYPMTNA
ncbi:MAG: glutamine synthetase type III, partial [Piscirickettsiaceae bacterium]|nr:glutamine synthetase type III [Piscirickettsiaceae bacterium]